MENIPLTVIVIVLLWLSASQAAAYASVKRYFSRYRNGNWKQHVRALLWWPYLLSSIIQDSLGKPYHRETFQLALVIALLWLFISSIALASLTGWGLAISFPIIGLLTSLCWGINWLLEQWHERKQKSISRAGSGTKRVV